MSKNTICYIDDNQSNLLLVRKALAEGYDIQTLSSTVKAVDRLCESKPDLILLDVNMPDIDGYELCRRIKSSPEIDNIPIVFLTCRKELEDRLTGFEAGGEAYITKPFDISELRHIVAALIQRRQQILAAEQKAEDTHQFAHTLLKNSSESSTIITYARELANTRDVSLLVHETFNALQNFGLKSTLLLKTYSGEIVSRSDRKIVTPLELELLELTRQGGRIINVGNKYLFIGKACVFLVKNMPVEEDDFTGRLRDHLAIMLDLLDAAMDLVNYEQKERVQQAESLDKTQSLVRQEFERMISLFDSFTQKSSLAFQHLAHNIEESFMFLGLTEEQEEQLSTYIETAKGEIEQFQTVGYELEESLKKIATQISS